MTEVSYKSESPYSKTPQRSWYMEKWVRRSVLPDISDKTLTVADKYTNRPDLLSYDLYGTTDYWWVFMARNIDIIRDPIFDLVGGITISVPLPERLQNVIRGV